jgi:TetR/AcrR family transcriptional regulator, transcriptional repressor for nem operon
MGRTREFDTGKTLQKAIQLFWEKGYNGVSTQELIDAFGISKSSLYAAYGDKMQLFIMALENYRLDLSGKTINRLKNCISIKKEIKSIFTEISRNALSDKKHKGCFVVNSIIELAPHNDEIAAIVKDHRARLEKAFTTAIYAGIATGEIGGDKNPENISRLYCNAISGIQVDAKYISNPQYFADVVKALLVLLN